MPNEKNWAPAPTISAAVSAARGSSIIVPTRYCTSTPDSRATSSATRRMMSRWLLNSWYTATSGTITSGSTRMPRLVALVAASKMARACISVISGYVMPSRHPR